tara:strand:+ start:77 stop:460 length:384 start_codon:yes stop_codon:yes gene_type:complete
MNIKHKHLIVRAEVSDSPSKEDLHQVLKWMKSLITKINMKLMHGPSISYIDQKGNRGTTCMALIETSHIVLHIWDENNPGLFQLDIYSCKDIEVNVVLGFLKSSFKVTKLEYKFLDRENNLTLVEED